MPETTLAESWFTPAAQVPRGATAMYAEKVFWPLPGRSPTRWTVAHGAPAPAARLSAGATAFSAAKSSWPTCATASGGTEERACGGPASSGARAAAGGGVAGASRARGRPHLVARAHAPAVDHVECGLAADAQLGEAGAHTRLEGVRRVRVDGLRVEPV